MFNQYKYNNDYTKENYARLTVLVPKGAKQAIEAHIASRGYKSTSDYFKSLLAHDMAVSDLSELVGGGCKMIKIKTLIEGLLISSVFHVRDHRQRASQ